VRRRADGMPRQTEAQFQASVLEYARLRGWRWWRDTATNTPRRCSGCGMIRRTPRNAAGWPDIVFIRRPRIIFVELKAEDGKVSEEQQAWLDDLLACGQEAYLWRPSDWDTVLGVLL
jgi:hypothetical protein